MGFELLAGMVRSFGLKEDNMKTIIYSSVRLLWLYKPGTNFLIANIG